MEQILLNIYHSVVKTLYIIIIMSHNHDRLLYMLKKELEQSKIDFRRSKEKISRIRPQQTYVSLSSHMSNVTALAKISIPYDFFTHFSSTLNLFLIPFEKVTIFYSSHLQYIY